MEDRGDTHSFYPSQKKSRIHCESVVEIRRLYCVMKNTKYESQQLQTTEQTF